MTDFCSSVDCCGCAACANACSRGAITMQPNKEGFLEPVIDARKCVHCGRCKLVCPFVNRGMERKPIVVLAARAKDGNLRASSSSGGVFSILARKVFERDGVVYGAAFRKEDKMVVHRSAEDEQGLEGLRGSKYVQSDIGMTFKDVRENLRLGRLVLFSGTPCQVRGLVNFLARPYSNLICVDVVCHSVPSPKAWRMYLRDKIAPSVPLSDCSISFRSKFFGWTRYAIEIMNSSGFGYRRPFRVDTFGRAYLGGLMDRPSCRSCPCRNLRSGSDLTIADCWGAEKLKGEWEDDKGSSVIMVNTPAGKEIVGEIKKSLVMREIPYEFACANNRAIEFSNPSTEARNSFYDLLEKGVGFDAVVNQLLPMSKIALFRGILGGWAHRWGGL